MSKERLATVAAAAASAEAGNHGEQQERPPLPQTNGCSEEQKTGQKEEEEHRNGCRNPKHLSILVPEQFSYESLAASGTLQLKHVIFSPLKAFHSLRERREQRSVMTSSSHSGSLPLRKGIDLPLVGEIKWADLKESMKAWLKNPKNLALLVWGLAVGISGAMLFLIMVGFLDRSIRSKSKRDVWFEINNQILNALFTMMCLYLHPQRILHLYLLYRWQPGDIKQLRKIYCKDGSYKPHEWSNMLVVVCLLNLNCFAQYALCGLNWGYRRSDRPVVGVGLCLAVAIGAPAIAGIYASLSSLGKEYEEPEAGAEERERIEEEEEKKLEHKTSFKISQISRLSRKLTFADKDGAIVENPEWVGGIFEIRKDAKIAYATTFCGFCVFGYNMERLGFGNRFVHTVTFILLCTAPYWVFFLAATNVDNNYVRRGMSYGGIMLCVFGLIYGGFWRIRMRKTFGLPPQTWCFGKASLTDYTQWLFCSLCTLCQEVRTSEAYKIRDSKFYERKRVSCAPPQGPIMPFCEEENGVDHTRGNVLKVCANEIVDHDSAEKVVEDHVELHPPKPLEIQISLHPSQTQESCAEEGTTLDLSAPMVDSSSAQMTSHRSQNPESCGRDTHLDPSAPMVDSAPASVESKASVYI